MSKLRYIKKTDEDTNRLRMLIWDGVSIPIHNFPDGETLYRADWDEGQPTFFIGGKNDPDFFYIESRLNEAITTAVEKEIRAENQGGANENH